LVLGTLGPWDLGTPGPWNPWTLGLLDLFPPPTPPHTSPYILLPPLISSSDSAPLVWLWGGVTLEDEIGDGPLTFILILKSCGVGGWNPGTSSSLLHYLPLTSSQLLLIHPSYSTLLLSPPKGSQMTNQFIHEEISMLFCSEKFYGGWVVVETCNYRVKLQVQVS